MVYDFADEATDKPTQNPSTNTPVNQMLEMANKLNERIEEQVKSKKTKKEPKTVDKKVLTFFLIGFPTILIIILGLFVNTVEPFVIWQFSINVIMMIQICIAIYQFIMLKQLINDYYQQY